MSSTLFRIFVSFLIVVTCACARDVVLPAANDAEFDPIKFFEGKTHGEGDLRKLFAKPVHVSVDSVGHPANDGLILDQTIREGSEPPSTRRWIIRRVAHNQYGGTLTDAVGGVTAQVVGPRAYIKYKMRHGLIVDQQLAQQSDGTTVLNRLVVHKFDARVATLSETIRKVAP